MKRKADESFEDYKKRRKELNLETKNSKKGRVIFNSGTYIKKIHGKI